MITFVIPLLTNLPPRWFSHRARCTATGFLRTEDASDFLHCWIYDVLNTHLQHNEPRIPSPSIDIPHSGSYGALFMFYLREKQLVHRFVEVHAGAEPNAPFEQIRQYFNKNSASYGLGNSSDFKLLAYDESQLQIDLNAARLVNPGRRRYLLNPRCENPTQKQFLQTTKSLNSPKDSVQAKAKQAERFGKVPVPVQKKKKKIVLNRQKTLRRSPNSTSLRNSGAFPGLHEAREFTREAHGEEYAGLGQACIRLVDSPPTRGASPMDLQRAYRDSSFKRQLTNEEIKD